MADLSPVETLRAAAARLRALATNATPGPWEREWAFSTHFVVPSTAGNVAADNVSRLKRHQRGDAEWIALMHPGVAEPLADWLEREAEDLAWHIAAWDHPHKDGSMVGCASGDPVRLAALTEERFGKALAVARVLLGVPDAR